MGLNKVIIESDSKAALLLIKKPYQRWHWKLNTLLSKILVLCEDREIRLTHIYREGNAVADELARIAISSRLSRILDPVDLPIRVRQLAYSDKSGLAYVRRVGTKVYSQFS